MKKLIALLWLMLVMIGTSSVAAQSPSDADLLSFELPDGTVIRYPSEYELIELEDPNRVQLDGPGGSFFVEVLDEDVQASTRVNEPLAAIALTYVPVEEDFVLPLETALELISNEVTVTWMRYIDDGYPGTIQAATMPNESILVIDAYGAFASSTDEGMALAILTDAALGNTRFEVDVLNVPPLPFDPQPIDDGDTLVEHSFSDGNPLRFGAAYEVEIDPNYNGDYLGITTPLGLHIVDYYSVAEQSRLGLDGVIDTMLASYVPDDPSISVDTEALRSVSLGKLTLVFWMYEDNYYPGILMGIQAPHGGILIIDSYGGFPGSFEESYAVAMAFDFAGDSNLLEGNAVELIENAAGGGLGSVFP